jgi:hypothetical protein
MSLGRKTGMRTGKAKPSKQPKAAKDPKTLLLTWGLHDRSASDGVAPGSGAMPDKQVRVVGFQAASAAVCVWFGSASLQALRAATAIACPLCQLLCRSIPGTCMAGMGVLVGLRGVHVSRLA